MERHRCKICFRNFGNGRALGDHMRSHGISFSKQVEEIHSCSTSQGEVVENIREDCEAEAEASRFGENITNEEEWLTSPTSSSVSDTTTEAEDVARCLMMMSRDRWERRNWKGTDDSEDDSGRHLVIRAVKRAKVIRGKYRCETCNKFFKSYQALGGHRASYGKINKADVAARPPPPRGGVAAEEKVHECPFCHRVFASGQALGGHKRSHFMGASNVRTVSRIGENLDIDLNLPAPVDDEINFTGN